MADFKQNNINHKPKGRFFWFVYAKGKPKVTMFAVEMWFGAGDGVECGRSTGALPLAAGRSPVCYS